MGSTSLPLLLAILCCACYAGMYYVLFNSPWEDAAASYASSERSNALYWMQRVRTVPYADWFNTNGQGGDEVPEAVRAEGQAIMPLHAAYVYGLSFVAEHWEPVADWSNVLQIDVDAHMSQECNSALCHRIHRYAAMGAAAVMCLTVPLVLWPLMMRVSRLLLAAFNDRTVAASGSNGGKNTIPLLAADVWTPRLAAIGFLVVFLFGLLPLGAYELLTLHPVSLCSTAVLGALLLIVSEEHRLVCKEEHRSDTFNLSKPFFQQGQICTFAKKESVVSWLGPIAAMGTLLAAMCLLLRPAFFVAPVLFIWILTLCYQRSYRRLMVRVKVPDGVDSDEADQDGFINVGYSSYTDRLHMQVCACVLMLSVLSILSVVCAPFIAGKQSLFDFMDLFAAPYPTFARGSSELLSYTGAREMDTSCLTGLPQTYGCTRPATNVWSVLEFFGVPLTRIASRFSSFMLPTKRTAPHADGHMWLEVLSVMILLLFNLVSLLSALLYRLRRVPLHFETPSQFVDEYHKQEASFDAYWVSQADKMRQVKDNKGDKKKKNSDNNNTNNKQPVVRTCITEDEYVLKQLTMVLWAVVCAITTSNVLLLHAGSSTSMVLVLFPAMLLRAMDVMVSALRYVRPSTFTATDHVLPLPTEESTKSVKVGGYVYKLPVFTVPGLARSTVSRWCSSLTLTEVSDVLWCIVMMMAVVTHAEVIFTTSDTLIRARQVTLYALVALFVVYAVQRRWIIRHMDVGAALVYLFVQGASGYIVLMHLDQSAVSAHTWWSALMEFVSGPPFLTQAEPLANMVYRCALCCVFVLGVAIQASVRIGRLALEREEVTFVDPASEMSYFAKQSPPDAERTETASK